MKNFGWIKDNPDNRDFLFFPLREKIETRPKEFDLTGKMPPVYDQGNLGSCTAQAIGGCLEYLNTKQRPDEKWTPSRLFIYYNERAIEGSINQDAGAMIRDGIKCVNSQGVCKEIPTWPYDVNRFTEKPPDQAYIEAMFHQSLKYFRVTQDSAHIETRISQEFPITCGILVYESFMSAGETGAVPMPKKKFLGIFNGDKLLGGHAIMIVGYNTNKQIFICRNSWGVNWGNFGYFTIPYDYILNNKLASDFWTITLME